MKEIIIEPIHALYEKAEEYSKTTIELLKLKAIAKSADVASALAVRAILVIIGVMFLLFASIAVALWTGELLGKVYFGFLAMTGFYGLAALLFYRFRNKWIKKPVSDTIIKKILE